MSLREERPDVASATMKQALSRQERECAAGAPSFARIAARIAAEPSAFEAPAWSVRKSARLAADLAVAQARVVPRAVLPAALIIAAAAAGAACFAVSAGAAGAAPWWFSTLLLLGVAITVTAALSTDAADALALAMPLGPQTVLLARLTTVLGVDALAGLAASAAFAWWGAPLGFGAVVLSWLAPLAVVAGVSAFVSVWTGSPWAAGVAGAAAAALAAPVGRAAADGGMAAALAGLQSAIGPEVVLAAGCALLAAAVATARRATAARGGSASGAWWALLDAQARRVRVVGIAVPLATAVLIAIAGSCWALAAGPASAALAMLGIMPLYAAAAGMCAAAVFTGDALVELHASTPTEFRAVQTMRAAVLLVAAAVGGFALFASLHLAGAIYGDAGWVGALSPAGGAALMVLVAYAAALSGSTRATTLVVMLVWLFFALIWDPNTASMPALQRGLPLLVLLAVGACAWHALGSPERVWRKLGGAR